MASKKKAAPAKRPAKKDTAKVAGVARRAARAEVAAADTKPSKTDAQVRKEEADKVNAAAGTPPTPAERKAFLSKFVGELTARPDAQERTIKSSLPTLSRYFGIDIPDVDMNVREHASAPAPGPMTRNVVVDPATLVNADKRQNLEVGAPAGGDEAAAVVALGAAQDSGKKSSKK